MEAMGAEKTSTENRPLHRQETMKYVLRRTAQLIDYFMPADFRTQQELGAWTEDLRKSRILVGRLHVATN